MPRRKPWTREEALEMGKLAAEARRRYAAERRLPRVSPANASLELTRSEIARLHERIIHCHGARTLGLLVKAKHDLIEQELLLTNGRGKKRGEPGGRGPAPGPIQVEVEPEPGNCGLDTPTNGSQPLVVEENRPQDAQAADTEVEL